MKDIFINKKVWKTFSEGELNQYVDDVYNHYRRHGFPYFRQDRDFRDNEFRKLMNYDGQVLDNDILKQTMHGLSLAWSYMPHSWNVRCNNRLTPLEAFNDDVTFRKVIRKRIRMGDNMSDNGIRKMLKMFSGVQSVSNFRPTVASALYSHYAPDGHVLDMSSGFGGRLLGAIKANVDYTGYDPSSATYEGLQEIIKDYGREDKSYTIIKDGSENMDFENKFDFAFTSPPYFDTEKYSDEITQSYKKFPTKEEWIEGFLRTTIRNTYNALKSGKCMALNVANVKSFSDFEEVTQRIALEEGFTFEKEMYLALSNSNFRNKSSAFKYEPIFIFKK